MNKVQEYITEAVTNIREDRAATHSLLLEAMQYVRKNEEHHKTVGPVLAKYLETLQRSNEQLVKVASMLNKTEASDSYLSDKDHEELYDLLNEQQVGNDD
tara:strand:- start:962 stop:1261 length:300 start_codon:yes stop_codon:yes gene_type:complete